MQETAQKTAQTAKSTAKLFERVKKAVIRAGQAVARAAVGLLGGAGALIALILIIGGAAAVIGTPFGVFWSGNDSDAQSVPQAVALINSEFSARINQIQAENPADSVVIHREPDGGSDLSITNWTDVVAVFAVKTAGADADATDVVTIDEERIDLIRTVFWDMNTVSYYVQTIKHEDSTETILHITITSKKATDMPDFYHFNKSQREALEEVLKPEYAQMLAELVGTYGRRGHAGRSANPRHACRHAQGHFRAAACCGGKSLFASRQSELLLGRQKQRHRLGFPLGQTHSRHRRRKQNDRNNPPLRTGLFRFRRLGIQQFTGLCDWTWRRRSQSA